MKSAVIQFTSGSDIDGNLVRMEKWLGEAARAGAKLVVFPELAYLYCEKAAWVPTLSRFEEIRSRFSEWAKRHEVFFLPGSLREPAGPTSAYNTALLYGPDGKELARYRKIFLFKAKLPDRDYDEGRDMSAGKELAVANCAGTKLGLSICYDIRFPEVFRALKSMNATAIAVPAAFTVPTGKAHWDVLTRARAIENQTYVLASGQVGAMGNGAVAYGHSRIISPWGEVLAEITEDSEGFACATLDAEHLQAARSKVDCWASRREDLFPINAK